MKMRMGLWIKHLLFLMTCWYMLFPRNFVNKDVSMLTYWVYDFFACLLLRYFSVSIFHFIYLKGLKKNDVRYDECIPGSLSERIRKMKNIPQHHMPKNLGNNKGSSKQVKCKKTENVKKDVLYIRLRNYYIRASN